MTSGPSLYTTSEAKDDLSAEKAVVTYKSLAKVERGLRNRESSPFARNGE